MSVSRALATGAPVGRRKPSVGAVSPVARQTGNPIQLELFEVGAIPTGNDAVSVAASRSRRLSKRRYSTFTQLCLNLN